MQKEKLRGKARDFIHTRIGVMRRAIVIKLSNVAVIRIETVRLMTVHFCITGETRAGGQMPHPVMLGLDGRERQRGERGSKPRKRKRTYGAAPCANVSSLAELGTQELAATQSTRPSSTPMVYMQALVFILIVQENLGFYIL